MWLQGPKQANADAATGGRVDSTEQRDTRLLGAPGGAPGALLLSSWGLSVAVK